MADGSLNAPTKDMIAFYSIVASTIFRNAVESSVALSELF